MFIDSHCHLSFPELHDQADVLVQRMQAAQVSAAVCICTELEEFERVHALALRYAQGPQLYATVGVHPDNEDSRTPSVDDLVTRASLPRVKAIGETGLDYYRLNGRSIADMQWQRERFRTHIQASRIACKPLVIHTRSSSEDTLRLMREEGAGLDAGGAGGVLHCFTETWEVAQAALDMGFYISFSGIVTFKNARELREVATKVPMDRLLIETDSPYLAPVPYRGKTNEPSFVPYVAACLAELRGSSLGAIADITTANAEKLFQLNQIDKAII
jgi:TatD DNase family protein